MTEFTSCNECVHEHCVDYCAGCEHRESLMDNFKPKPVLKTIDLSVCIKSKIDMEFWTSDTLDKYYVAKLVDIKNGVFFSSLPNQPKWLHRCRVRQDHWHSWQGRANCPLPEGLIVEVIYRGERNEILLPEYAEATWTWRGLDASDIIAFRILGTADNAYYEWDKDE